MHEKKNNIIIIFIKCLFMCIIIYKIIEISFFIKNKNNRRIVNKPIIIKVKHVYKNNSNLKVDHMRYNFQNIYKTRKIFKINYSYYPYTEINKSISYEKNGDNIYKSTGMLNITKLDYFYNGTDVDTIKLNHIHVGMALDKKNFELSLISIASLLNKSHPITFIHFHILCLDLKFKEMTNIINLKKINKNIDFIFYNAKQAKYDFGERGSKEMRGVGNYAKILCPEIVNSTDKILIIDSGDTIVQKDLSEIFYYNLEDNYFSWILEDIAGNNENVYDLNDQFFRNIFYPNAGVFLVNISLFRKDELYKKAYYISKSYKELACPVQDILISISIYKFKYLPLKYNTEIFFDNDKQLKNKINDTNVIRNLIKHQKYSPYKYNIEEILDAAYNPFINHFYHNKIQLGRMKCSSSTMQWIKYAKLTGLYKEIKSKYPIPFRCEKSKNQKIYVNSKKKLI